jgi:hypothetical protein
MESRTFSKEKKSILMYTGVAYKTINGSLRAGETVDHVKGFDLQAATNAITRGELHDDYILSRKVAGNSSLNAQWESLSEGSVFVDKGFMSTTFLPTTEDNKVSGVILFNIRAPKGTSGAYVGGVSKYGSECEFVLPPGTALYVHNTYETARGARVIEATVLPQKSPQVTGKTYIIPVFW